MSQPHASACRLACLASAFGLAAALSTGAFASDNKIALIPGGPHPYFAPWEQAAKDAQKDFGIAAVDFKVPQEWKLNLQTELVESLAAQGYKGFGIFPGDAVGINSTVSELKSAGIPRRRSPAAPRTRPTSPSASAPTSTLRRSGTKHLIKAMGGKGNIVHLAGLLVDPNTTLRVRRSRPRSARPTAPLSFSRPSPIPTHRKRPTRRSTRCSPGRRTRSTA